MHEQQLQTLKQSVEALKPAAQQMKQEEALASVAKHLATVENAPTTLLVCGEFNRGKSTFINALLGEHICATDTDICTSVVTTIRYGAARKARRFYGDLSNPKAEEVDFDDVEIYTVGTAQEIGNTFLMELELPMESLKDGLTVIDTPGVGGLDPRHAMITNAFLPKADVVCFMTDCNEPLTTTELDFYKKVSQYARYTAVIVNKADLKPADDVEQIRLDTRNKVAQHTQQPVEAIDVLAVSAADCIREEDGLGNFPALRALIDRMVGKHRAEGLEAVRRELEEIVDHMLKPLQLQRKQIVEPDQNHYNELLAEQKKVQEQIAVLTAPNSPFRAKLASRLVEERNAITDWYASEQTKMLSVVFKKILENEQATGETAGEWVGKKLNEHVGVLASEITTRTNQAIMRIARMKELGGTFHFKVQEFTERLPEQAVETKLPLIRMLLSAQPGWGIGAITNCGVQATSLASTGIGLAIPLIAGAWTAIMSMRGASKQEREKNLQEQYKPQLADVLRKLQAHLDARFGDVQRELLETMKKKADAYKQELDTAKQEIDAIRRDSSLAAKNKTILESKVAALTKIQNALTAITF